MTAQFHDKVARTWLKEHSIEVPGGLNYLKIDSKAGQEYLQVIYSLSLCKIYYTSSNAATPRPP